MCVYEPAARLKTAGAEGEIGEGGNSLSTIRKQRHLEERKRTKKGTRQRNIHNEGIIIILAGFARATGGSGEY